MEIERARGDALVAAAAAGATIALALLSSRLPSVSLGRLATVVPLGVYAAYAFTRKGGPYAAVDTPRNWALAALLVGVTVLAVGAV